MDDSKESAKDEKEAENKTGDALHKEVENFIRKNIHDFTKVFGGYVLCVLEFKTEKEVQKCLKSSNFFTRALEKHNVIASVSLDDLKDLELPVKRPENMKPRDMLVVLQIGETYSLCLFDLQA